jgi:hypothetical protein
MGIKFFNNLLYKQRIIAHDVENFKEELKKNFLYSNLFYPLDEYSIYKDN